MGQEYEDFVEKFKSKLTTDDCYTPDAVYEAVRDWATKEYNLAGREIVRPFWPGGDYEQFEYPEGCVVIDNPPFSILAKIKAFYAERKIGYFLFAPHLTIFSSGGGKCGERYIVANANVIYENGAKVNTSFVTSLDASFIRTAPELKRAVEKASKEAAREKTKELPKYKYPYTVISAALLGKVSGVDFAVRKHECAFIRALDAQKSVGKTIFGAGFLISEGKAAELRAAELRAAELRAAEETIEWGLSEREQAIINQL